MARFGQRREHSVGFIDSIKENLRKTEVKASKERRRLGPALAVGKSETQITRVDPNFFYRRSTPMDADFSRRQRRERMLLRQGATEPKRRYKTPTLVALENRIRAEE